MTDSQAALVTGVNGFVGEHVAAELRARGRRTIGVGREATARPRVAAHLDQYLACDMIDAEQVAELPVGSCSAVVNLAGLAAIGPSFDDPAHYARINTAVLEHVCAAALRAPGPVRVLAISSGAVYDPRGALPLTEDSPVEPSSSPYAASKLAMEQVAAGYRARGLDCVVVRPFNHIGPGQSSGFLVPDLYRSIAAVAAGSELTVGNLTTERDYTDVRDVARAYADLTDSASLEAAVYNVCAGRSVRGEVMLQLLLQELGRPDLPVRVDPARFRPADVTVLRGCNRRISEAVGWTLQVSLQQSVRDFVARAREAGVRERIG